MLLCNRQNHGMPDNCALCKALTPDLYNPCLGEPNKIVKPKEIFVPKKLSHEESKKQIIDYIQSVGGKIHVSEIAEKLKMDIELVSEILEE